MTMCISSLVLRASHCPDISKYLAISTVSGKGWIYWKANSCEASGPLNDRGPFQGSYLTVPCNYIFVIFKIFFISNLKLFMLQAQQNMDLLLETIYLWCLIKWKDEWLYKLSNHCLKVVFHSCPTSHTVIINTSHLGSVFFPEKCWCLKFSNSKLLLFIYNLLDITSPIFGSIWKILFPLSYVPRCLFSFLKSIFSLLSLVPMVSNLRNTKKTLLAPLFTEP